MMKKGKPMFCTSCGNEIPEGAQFCTSCGAKAPSPVTNKAQATPAANEAQAIPANDAFAPPQPPASAQQPASAYTPKYSTGAPVPQQTPQHTKVMPQVAAATAGAAGAVAQAVPVDNSMRTKKIILAAMIVVIVALIIAVICLFSCSRKAVAIDSTNFPNEKIREAVTVGLDIDGDGVLSPEEADAVAGMIFTPTSVQFVTDYNGTDSVNEYKQTWDKDPYLETGRGSSSDYYTDPDEEIRHIIEVFPDMQTLTVRGLGLTKLDISTLSKLEYLDCTGNSISSIDLSKNKSLVSMFCDDNVSLTGTDKAGLYYRDLITSVSDSRGSNSTKFAYDYMGRVTKSSDKTFRYDEDGRLTRAQNGTGTYDWYEEYKYNGDGLLAEAYVYQPLDETKEPFTYVYEYDDKKRLTAYSKEFINNVYDSGTIEYSGDAISSIKTMSSSGSDGEQTMKVTTDKDGRITEVSSTGDHSNEAYTYKYLPNGECSDWTASGRTSSYITEYSYATVFSSDDIPQSTKVHQAISAANEDDWVDVIFETNADGYITKIITPSGSAGVMLSGETLSVSYVKHVGKLEDLPAQRYVPIYRVANPSTLLGEMMWHLNSDMYSSTGGVAAISILEDGPMQVTFQALGLAPNLVSNPNEQKLAEYLAEHWGDKMEVKSAATASSKSVQSVSKSSAANDSARVINTEYFTFTMPESWVGKVEMTEDHEINLGQTHEGGPNQELHSYNFRLKENTDSRVAWDVLSILVTNDPTGELGEVGVAGEFKTSGGLEGYVCYNPFAFEGVGAFKPYAKTYADLLSGGQIKYKDSYTASEREENRKIIEAWLKANVVPNIKAK